MTLEALALTVAEWSCFKKRVRVSGTRPAVKLCRRLSGMAALWHGRHSVPMAAA
jgi:hypothetical protein